MNTHRLLSMLLVLCVLSGCQSTSEVHEKREANTVTGQELQRSAPTAVNISELIEGRIAGIRVVNAADGSVQVQTTSRVSIYGSNAVLIVVDDFPVEPNANGTLPGLNVSEIVSIKLLKDLTETSRYGMRGSNGVILVTTKGASKPTGRATNRTAQAREE